jgi:hypothetical protein
VTCNSSSIPTAPSKLIPHSISSAALHRDNVREDRRRMGGLTNLCSISGRLTKLLEAA